jgi:hypothetical protein
MMITTKLFVHHERKEKGSLMYINTDNRSFPSHNDATSHQSSGHWWCWFTRTNHRQSKSRLLFLLHLPNPHLQDLIRRGCIVHVIDIKRDTSLFVEEEANGRVKFFIGDLANKKDVQV